MLDRLNERYATDPAFRAKKMESNRKNHDPVKSHIRHMRYYYGLQHGEYDQMVEAQGGVCKICSKFHTSKRFPRLSVDHDHKTGKVRGLLCFACNSKLGWFENRRDAIEEYLS